MRRIKRLPDEVISRIAAGEVVVSPSHALKELVENSLDADSKNIILQLKKGGIQSLQISDDGCGIERCDFPLLCERFTTSKLTTMKDIESLTTFGFRGEALSSISFVSLLTITSMVENSKCAYKASFSDGKMTSEIEDVASAKKGTIVQFNDLFYNMPARQRSLGSPSDEYARCLELIQKYCIEFPNVSFSVRKFGNNSNDLRTNGGKNTNRKSVISMLYGTQLVKELIHFTISNDSIKSNDSQNHNKIDLNLKIPDYSVELYISGLGYNPKQNTLIIFINGRLVKNSAIKQAVEVAYQYTKTHYWVFVSVTVPPDTIDPNVHPTKNLVYIKHELLIAEIIQKKVISSLQGSNYSRTINLEKKSRFELKDYTTLTNNESNNSKNITRVRTDSKQLLIQEYTSNNTLKHSNIPLVNDIKQDNDEKNLSDDQDISEEIDLNFEITSNENHKEYDSSSNNQNNDMISNTSSEITNINQNSSLVMDQGVNNKQIFRLFDISNYVANTHILDWCLKIDSIILNNIMKIYQVKIKEKFLTNMELKIDDTETSNFDVIRNLTRNVINGIYIGEVGKNWSIIQASNQILLIKLDELSKIAIKQSIIYRLGFIPLFKFNPVINIDKLSIFSSINNKNIQNNYQEFEKFINKDLYYYLDYLKIIGIDINTTEKTIITFPLFFGSYVPNIDLLPEFFEQIVNIFWKYHNLHNSNKVFNKEFCNRIIYGIDYIDHSYELFNSIIDTLIEYYIYEIQENELLYQTIRNNSNLILLEENIKKNIIELSNLEKLYKVFERC